MCDDCIRSLSATEVLSLLAYLSQLLGNPTEGCMSHAQVTHLMQRLRQNPDKRLRRDQFIDIDSATWIDEDNGVGTLLVEHSC